MDAILPARRDFLRLARQTLVRFGADPAALEAPQMDIEAKIGIEFVVEGVGFVLVHNTDPQIDNLILVSCAFGPLPISAARESCMRLLEANYELSALLLTGFALDEAGNCVYTHSCAMPLWDDESMAALIEGMAALALRWRNGGILDAEGLGALTNHAMPAVPSAFA
ncbi:hypothetical protein SRS16CHR_04167 [Variovorax sp. SRS16]|uniref:hypothetical protein n=1 Tax=Variovorax sp. SRS16 TaxID=282217 RepID=UPI0013192C1E|nr:hypothetical protein [Variovorax sp. SRS16]VTU27947.1 hypothetical protein SRS16CHR_04167 [Variovorax sp. SRS16]